MLYQEYKAKLAKRQRLIERLWKFRLLILSAAILLVVSTGTLMGIKGMSYAFEAPAKILYGQSYTPSSSCIFGEVSYEYRKVGDEHWTDQCPIYAGSYQCRTVTTSVFGTKRTGSAHNFEIAPTELNVVVYGSDLQYGAEPVFHGDTSYGDRVMVSNYTLQHSAQSDEILVCFDSQDVTVVNSADEDVTDSYIVGTEQKALHAQLRPVTLTMPTLSVEYDGQAHAADVAAVQADGLLPKHRVEATFQSFTEAGTYPNQRLPLQEGGPDYRIVEDEGDSIVDRTYMYNVDWRSGSVEISKRKIIVGASLQPIVYDGAEHVYRECNLLEGTTLADGQDFRITDFCSGTDVGSYTPITNGRIAVYEGEKNVTSNYDITRRFDPMVISKRPVTLCTADAEFTYDSAEHSFADVTTLSNTPLASGHSLDVAPFVVTNANEQGYVNAPACQIVDADGRIVTSNYQITDRFGTVVVHKRPITVATVSHEFWYSGLDNVPSSDLGEIVNGDALLPPNDAMQLSYDGLTMVNANEQGYTNKPVVTIFNADRQDITSLNYVLSYADELGKIVVHKRNLSIATQSDTFVYNAEEQFAEGYDVAPYDENGNGLALGHNLQVQTHTAIKNFSDSGKPNELTFVVQDGNGNDVSANYNQSLTYGTLSVDKATISVRTDDAEKVYDGAPFEHFSVTVDGLVHDESWVLSDITHGELPIDCTSQPVSNSFSFTLHLWDGEQDEDVTENYNVVSALQSVTYGSLTITQRSVTFTMQTGEFTYDAQSHTFEEIAVSGHSDDFGNGLVHGHKLQSVTFRYFADVVDTAPDNNTPISTGIILDGEGHDVTANYIITWHYGTVTVLPRPVTFTTQTAQFTYNALPHTYNEIEVSGHSDDLGDGLVQGHKLQGVEFRSFTNVADTSDSNNYPLSAGDILDGEGNDVAANYIITWHYGTVTVLPRPVTFTTQTAQFTYDAQPHTFEEIAVSGHSDDFGSGLVQEHTLQGVEFRSFINVADTSDLNNAPLYSGNISDGAGNYVDANYDITWRHGTVTIDKRPVTLSTDSVTVTYRGKQGFDFSSLMPSDGSIADSDSLEVTPLHLWQATEGPVVNAPTYDIVRSGVSQLDNYNISKSFGEIVIERLVVDIDMSVEIGGRPLTFTYDAQPHTFLPLEANFVKGNFAEGDTPNYINFLVDIVNAGTYNPDLKVQVLCDGEDVTSNYDISITKAAVTIDKRPVTLSTDSVTVTYRGKQGYDFNEINATGGLPAEPAIAAGDILDVTPLHLWQATEEPIAYAPTYDITRDGVSQLGNYNISESFGEIVIERLKVEIDMSVQIDGRPLTFTYDAQPHSFLPLDGNFVQGDFAEGDTPNYIDFLVNIVDAGTYSPNLDVQVHCDGDDVTSNYNISVMSATVTIEKRPLALQTTNKDVFYSGQSNLPTTVSEAFLFVDGALQGRDELRFDYGRQTMVDANEDGYVNNPSFNIVRDGVNQDDNYEVNVQSYGNIVVRKRKIDFQIDDISLGYNGKLQGKTDSTELIKYSWYGEVEQGFCVANGSDHTFIVSNSAEYKDCGDYDMVCSWKVLDGSGADVSKNYNFIPHDKTTPQLHITQRSLTFTVHGDSKVYDGTPLTCNKIDVGGLVDDPQHTIKYNITETLPSLTDVNVDGILNKFAFEFTVTDEEGYDVTRNYAADWDSSVYGTLSVTPYGLTVSPAPDWGWTYDATCHLDWQKSFVVSNTAGGDQPLPNGMRLSITFSNIVNAGGYYAVWSDESVSPSTQAEDTFLYSFKVYLGDEDVTRNFVFTDNVRDQYLNVLHRKIRMITGSGEFEYDGDPHSVEEIVGDNLVKGHHLDTSSIAFPSYTDVRQSSTENNKPTWETVIVDSDGNDVTRNYSVGFNYGTVTILPRPITVTTRSAEFVYDSTVHKEYNTCKVTSDKQLVQGHKLVSTYGDGYCFANDVPYTNAWTSLRIENADKQDVTSNYEITPVYGQIKINKRPITVRLKADALLSWTYDKQFHLSDQTDCVEVCDDTTLCDLEQISISWTYWSPTAVNAGLHKMGPMDSTAEIKYEISIIKTLYGANRTSNYEITDKVQGSQVEVVRRNVTIDPTGEWDRIYNGKTITFEENFAVLPADDTQGLLDGHYITANFAHNTSDVGTYTPKRAISPTASEGKIVYFYEIIEYVRDTEIDVIDNYNIVDNISDKKTFTISRRPITVDRSPYYEWDWEYNAECNIDSGYFSIADGSTGVDYQYIQIDFSQRPNKAGTHFARNANLQQDFSGDDLVYTIAIYDSWNSLNVTDNYDITDNVDGTSFEIAKYRITIITDSRTWVYNQDYTIYSEGGYSIANGRGFLPGHNPEYTPTQLFDITDTADSPVYIDNEFNNFRIVSGWEDDVTNNYDITWRNGTLRIKTPIVVRIYTVNKTYDGQGVKLTSDNYRVEKRPPDIRKQDIELNLVYNEMTRPGTVSLEDFSNANVAYNSYQGNTMYFYGEPDRPDNAAITVHNCTDGVCGIQLLCGSQTVIRINKRNITLRPVSAKEIWGEGKFIQGSYQVSGKLALGEYLKVEMSVLYYYMPSIENTVVSFSVLNSNGEDLTNECYNVTVSGAKATLSWINYPYTY